MSELQCVQQNAGERCCSTGRRGSTPLGFGGALFFRGEIRGSSTIFLEAEMKQDGGLRLSRFVHFYPLGNYVAVYNALNLAVLFLEKGRASSFQKVMKSPVSKGQILAIERDGKDDQWGAAVERMLLWRILLDTNFDEMGGYYAIRESLSHLPVGILYLLLTDQCNFACRYCFIEGAKLFHRKGLMTVDVAKCGIDVFTQALVKNPHPKGLLPQIIFYGGEPLINTDCLFFALGYIRRLIDEGVRLSEDVALTLNTNASLVTPRIARKLAENKVRASVSIDGIPKVHNAQRIFRSGKETFAATERGLLLLQDAGVETSISFTITWQNLNYLEESLSWLVEKYGVRSLGFNIHRDSDMIKVENPTLFSQLASEAIIRCFEVARRLGVYEDRVMRKVNAFVSGKQYLNDCGGCGQQIVVSPNGDLGVCHVLSPDGKYFTPYSADFNPRTHLYWEEWRARSPFSMPQCLDCIALGMCGGGCPQQALLKKGTIWELDEVFCVHAKVTLDFLLRDLLAKTIPVQK